jgi:hypothetical protein
MIYLFASLLLLAYVVHGQMIVCEPVKVSSITEDKG